MQLWAIKDGKPLLMAEGPEPNEPFFGLHFHEELKVVVGVVFRLKRGDTLFELHINRDELTQAVEHLSGFMDEERAANEEHTQQ